METNTVNPEVPTNAVSRINWGAICGGTFIAMFFQLLLGLLGLAVGLSVLGPGRAVSPQGMGIGTGIWLILVTVISVFIGAFAAGRFAGMQAKYDGLMHGVATLAFLTILSVFLVSSGVSNVIGGAFTFGMQAAQTPQVQQAMPQGVQPGSQPTGAAAPAITPQQRLALEQKANKLAKGATWIAFITGLLSLIVAAIGGFLGMQSRIKQMYREAR
jgi:hypothetical protein